MKKLLAVSRDALLLGALTLSPAVAQQGCPTGNATVPPGANTTAPSAPFYIDTRGLDLSTMPPTRDPNSPDYPRATELPDGTLPGAGAEGNFIIGPTHAAAPETMPQTGVPLGSVHSFTMTSNDSLIYKPGMVRDDPNGCLDAAVYQDSTVPGDPSNLLVPESHPGTWTRTVDVYVPAVAGRGAEFPFIVAGDGGGAISTVETALFTSLDNLIAQHRVPPMVAIAIGPGGQDAQGSERGREYDAVSPDYADWVEREVLPLVEQTTGVRLTKDPDGRATMGISSSGAAAFTMAWFRTNRYHRVLAYSPTFVNQQWPHNTALPGGAWEYHSAWAGSPVPILNVQGFAAPTPSDMPLGAPLVPNSPTKPIRFWFEVGDHDLFYPVAPMPDGMHDWVLANERMAATLAAKGYHYQFIFARNAGHVDGPTVDQTLPSALEWLWDGYWGVRSPAASR